MNWDESVALWRQGRDAWNTWANGLLRQKAELEQAGTWKGNVRPEEYNDETREWFAAARVDFSKRLFMTRSFLDRQKERALQPSQPEENTLMVEEGVIDFQGFVFPPAASFE